MRENKPLVVYSILSINLLIWVLTEIIGSSRDPMTLRQFGAITYLDINNGDYWRLFSAIFLHVGAGHLAVNCLSLLIMGGLLEKMVGHSRFAVIYIGAGISGSSFSYLMIPFLGVGAGASGAIFGCVGALAGYFIVNRKSMGEMGKQNLNAVLILAGINFAFGYIVPGIDNWAHLGGFIAGAILGIGVVPRAKSLYPINFRQDYGRKPFSSIKIRTVISISFAILMVICTLYLGNTRLIG
ncbi:MAG: rhomboid family intramembrane serine protease [Dehalococcoidia bacterium]